MSKTAEIRVRIEPEIKDQAEKILKTIGLNEAEAVRIYYRNIITHKGLPFELKIPNKETLKAIREAEKGEVSKGYDSVDELFEDLNK